MKGGGVFEEKIVVLWNIEERGRVVKWLLNCREVAQIEHSALKAGYAS